MQHLVIRAEKVSSSRPDKDGRSPLARSGAERQSLWRSSLLLALTTVLVGGTAGLVGGCGGSSSETPPPLEPLPNRYDQGTSDQQDEAGTKDRTSEEDSSRDAPSGNE